MMLSDPGACVPAAMYMSTVQSVRVSPHQNTGKPLLMRRQAAVEAYKRWRSDGGKNKSAKPYRKALIRAEGDELGSSSKLKEVDVKKMTVSVFLEFHFLFLGGGPSKYTVCGFSLCCRWACMYHAPAVATSTAASDLNCRWMSTKRWRRGPCRRRTPMCSPS